MRIAHEAETDQGCGGVVTGQGPRAFVRGADGAVFALFRKGIAWVNSETFALRWLARSPVPISAGADAQNGRVFFAG